MKVNTIFIHPTKGLQDVSILNATSVQHVVEKLEEIGCKVLMANEEGENK